MDDNALWPLWSLVWWIVGVAITLLIVVLFVRALRRDDQRGLVRCLHCAELVQPAARVCRYCGRERTSGREPARRLAS